MEAPLTELVKKVGAGLGSGGDQEFCFGHAACKVQVGRPKLRCPMASSSFSGLENDM